MKKLLVLFLGLLWVMGSTAVYGGVKNPDTFVLADIGSVDTLDPAKNYDVAGTHKIWTVYETLVFFDGPHTDKFVPVLATEVPTVENGGISPDGKTYTFKIRKGVKFHEGQELTPEDVVYSLKRAMICDPAGGPMWMLLEALTGYGSTRKGGKIIPGIFEKIDKAIEAKGDKVILHLPKPYPPLMGILCYSASCIINKKWAISKGCWDGDIRHAAKYNNPPEGKEPLQSVTNGTGPYKLKLWQTGNQFVFERFDGYWGPKPKIKTAIVKIVPEWSTRKLMLQNGDADRVHVGKPYVNEVKAMKGVKVYEVPQLAVTGAMFCQKINPTGNDNIGSGKLDGNGIPPDFFSDINVRKAFLHAYDRDTFKKEVLNNLCTMPPTPLVEGLAYYNKDIPVYDFDLNKAKEYMKKAWGGKVWKKGFKMVITYNTGREEREAAALMLKENIESLNPKFKIEVRNVEWKDYMVNIRAFKYPVFIIGWGADYPDPHNFMYPYMSSDGTYGKYIGYSNPEVDRLLKAGIENVDPQKRADAYNKLQQIWYKDALGIVLFQPKELWAYRDYVHGFVPNPMFPPAEEFFYRLWKE
ncbi:MAG: ABC transporter substrate-binding protein [Deltaproteobacteria bacterium]|nr:ABC transporter substrate-binding protein [Deltaproteobacteria bacterium]MBW2016988.1 ABC transporter substrate-binding protein [Deltaproteobacteria bacterium]MBW2129900.1 ABC transporter substrate-binding protein [Deltaproteobacteria bacterium]